MCEQEGDQQFLSSLQDLRLGQCSKESFEYVHSLYRDLDVELKNSVVHIFFKQIPAQLHNMSVLSELPGEFLKLEAIKERKAYHVSCRGSVVPEAWL